MRRTVAVALGVCALLSVRGLATAQSHPQCLATLSATAANATSGRSGQMMTATADASGFCSFTVTACVNDTGVSGCTASSVNSIKVLGGSRLDLSGLQQSLQTQMPTNQKACATATVKVGQTLHRKVRAVATTNDGRIGADSLTLSCQCSGNAAHFTSTFDGIQKVIFDGNGCSQDACHGIAKQNGLQLTAGVSYQNLFEVPSVGSNLNRVQPGDKDRSFLWLKVAAKTDPSQLPPGVQVGGAPMPNNLPAISAGELEALRLWIYSGAPQTGTIAGTETLLNACLPPPEPITIKPLAPPAPGQGVQFVMPPWKLEAHSEHEICFATYYDISKQVPKQFQDPSGTLFRFDGQDLRQDPQSHHLILNRYVGSADDIHDPSFGTWTCNGGAKNGQTCEPTDLTSCGSGTCISTVQQSFACLGFGPQQSNQGAPFYAIGGAQTAQSTIDYLPGVFAQIPMKGIFYWNSHAFNLTDEDTIMHARLNYYFASAQQFPAQPIFDTSMIFAANAPPYTTQTICNDFTLPQGARLFNLSSHTHHHGKHFTVNAPDGSLIYESFVYNDPANLNFDPPMAFDSPDPVQRTLHYCSLYNNGVNADGSPDVSLVTRRSLTPQSAKNTIGLCTPIECVSGKIGARCRGVGDDRTCDSAPGANDGSCDACAIKGGESTQNEMFILIGNYYVDPSAAQAVSGAAAFRAFNVDASGRSLSTDLILPPQMGCGASHSAHTMHAMHAGHHHPQ